MRGVENGEEEHVGLGVSASGSLKRQMPSGGSRLVNYLLYRQKVSPPNIATTKYKQTGPQKSKLKREHQGTRTLNLSLTAFQQ